MKIKIYPPQAIHCLGARDNQEDTIYPALGKASECDRLFLVCDGMGGHEHGEVASQMVATAFSEYLAEHQHDNEPLADTLLNEALETAYKRLDPLDKGEIRKMGTTLTLLSLHSGGVTVAHIGDSRIYHLRPSAGSIPFVSRDHSLVMDLYQAGEITRNEMATHPRKNIITRAISPGEDNRTHLDIVHITDVKPGDYFYLCSDGMLEQMTDDELLRLLAQDITDEEKRDQLIEKTEDNRDNHSAYLIRVKQVVNEPGDEKLVNEEETTRFNAINLYRRREAESEELNDDDVEVTAIDEPELAEVGKAPSMPPMTKSSSKKGKIFILLAALIAIAALAFLFLSNKQPKSPSRAIQPETTNQEELMPPAYTEQEQATSKSRHQSKESNQEAATPKKNQPAQTQGKDTSNTGNRKRGGNFQNQVSQQGGIIENQLQQNNPNTTSSEE